MGLQLADWSIKLVVSRKWSDLIHQARQELTGWINPFCTKK